MGHPSVEPKAHVGEELEALPRTNRRDAAGKKSLEGAILLSKKQLFEQLFEQQKLKKCTKWSFRVFIILLYQVSH